MRVVEGVHVCDGVIDCVNVGLLDALRDTLCVAEGVLDVVRERVELCEVVCDAVRVRDAVREGVSVRELVWLGVNDSVGSADTVCVAVTVGVKTWLSDVGACDAFGAVVGVRDGVGVDVCASTAMGTSATISRRSDAIEF